MTDVFISYAHEDQAFVRRMVSALEAEGFSVWWDHTIPPGKTWNTVIAKGIAKAKACIVVWSKHSVASKWVLEEATLANNAEKLLPVSVDASAPPMGFLSLQSAQLAGWSSDRKNAQWRLLVGEVRELVRAEVKATASPPHPISNIAQQRKPGKALLWAIVAGVPLLAAIAGSSLLLLSRSLQKIDAEQTTAMSIAPSTPSPRQDDNPDELVPQAVQQATTTASPPTTTSVQSRSAQNASCADQQTTEGSPVGTWRVLIRNGESWHEGHPFTFCPDGTVVYELDGDRGHWSQTDTRVTWAWQRARGMLWEGQLEGDRIAGSRSYAGAPPVDEVELIRRN